MRLTRKKPQTHTHTRTQEASTEEVKRAYKRKSLALHPDKLAQRGQVLTPEDQARVSELTDWREGKPHLGRSQVQSTHDVIRVTAVRT